MSEHSWFIIAIVIYMAVMLGIGYWSYTQTKKYDEYMLGGRGLGPVVAALSAGASDMSGWLLMGLPGALFVAGFSELWIAIGLLIGCWANWKWIAPRLRSYTEVARNSITVPSFIENRLHDTSHVLRITSAVVILVFFTFYVSSGMVSGGKYFESTFGGDYLTGMLIVAAITVAYTFVGGFLAVSYTDAVQGLIMFASLIIVPVMAVIALDNPMDIFGWQTTNDYGPYTGGEGNPNYFNMISGVSIAAIIGNMAWGLGYFGQPHIIVRFMAMRKPADAVAGRRIGIFWMLLCIVGALFTAMIGTVFFAQNPNIDVTDTKAYETVFLDMGRILFHPLIAGLVLTAVLAAIMSTISSQLLVTSSALIEDLYMITVKRQPRQKNLMWLSRLSVLLVAVVAGVLAVNPSDSILGLVGFAWAGFGSAFGPIVIAALFWKRLNTPGAIAGMIAGAVVSFAWGQSALSSTMYEIVPGFLANVVFMVAVSLMTKAPAPHITEQFDKASRLSREKGMLTPEMLA
ncbi:Sodium/proline symporter [Corynebacterium kalinowskii]|uniref:Sodium/proline symporter n=1 Tax=Corynebacterium kalinowskii TaxID=2675216 RepID=A0A6B8VRW4_9CORY|nr:sodium/proline symporter PutP [Corynebacterium kalinowskii]QGU01755.1 Sodium/proline symporter [Corynebacterium kalinowskii]